MKYGIEANEIAKKIKGTGADFLKSNEWRELRKLALSIYGHKCMKCGSAPKNRSKINVDHIKCRKFYPELRLDLENLQILCSYCNRLKGNKHSTDYRVTTDSKIKQIG